PTTPYPQPAVPPTTSPGARWFLTLLSFKLLRPQQITPARVSRIKTVDNIADNSASVQHHFQNAAFRGSLKGARGLGERKAVGNHVKYIDAPRSQQIQRWFKTAAPRSNERDYVDDESCRVEWRGCMNGGFHEDRSSRPDHPDRLI